MKDFEDAIDRVIAGPEKRHRALSSEEKKRVAFHESGHTLVAETVPTGEPVHKVSIIPRGVAALGYTLQLPVEEKFLTTESEFKDQMPSCWAAAWPRRSYLAMSPVARRMIWNAPRKLRGLW